MYLTAASARERRKTAAVINITLLGTLSCLHCLGSLRAPVVAASWDPGRCSLSALRRRHQRDRGKLIGTPENVSTLNASVDSQAQPLIGPAASTPGHQSTDHAGQSEQADGGVGKGQRRGAQWQHQADTHKSYGRQIEITTPRAQNYFNAATTASKNTIGSIGSLSTGLGWAPKVTITTLLAGLT